MDDGMNGGTDDGTDGVGADGELLSIGLFAARARLSAKALRLYDRLGLLTPARVDGVSGYRYYREGQIEQARLVALLRRLDMPLARIAEIVEADGMRTANGMCTANGTGTATGAGTPAGASTVSREDPAQLLDAYWSEAEARHAERRALAAYLRRRMTGRHQEMTETTDPYPEFTVELVDVPEQLLLTETRHILADELPVWIPAALGRLEEAAASCGGLTAHPFVAYHAESSMESDGPAEACVPVGDEEAARVWADVQPRTRNTRTRLEPARRLAVTRITKAQVAHPQILEAYEAVEAWMKREGWSYDGPCREIYFTDWDAAGPEDPVCDVAFPVRRDGDE